MYVQFPLPLAPPCQQQLMTSPFPSSQIPYPANAKKPDLVKLFNKYIKPQAAALLAQSSAVQPSDVGILDGDSQNGSLKELDTDSEEERRFEEEQARKKRAKQARKSAGGGGSSRRKSLSAAVAAIEQEEQPKSSLKKGKGKGRVREEREEAMSVDEQSSQADEEDEEEEEEREPSPPPKQKKGRKSARPEPVEVSEMSDDDVVVEAPSSVSPKKRKAQVRFLSPFLPSLRSLTLLSFLAGRRWSRYSSCQRAFRSQGSPRRARHARSWKL
jgi:hypothetical protein